MHQPHGSLKNKINTQTSYHQLTREGEPPLDKPWQHTGSRKKKDIQHFSGHTMSQHFTPATFHFNRPHKPALSASTTASEDDRALVLTSDTSATGSDVHPVELVVQSVVGPLLDSLSGKLGQLQESQLILVSRLKILERQLDHYDQNVSVVDSAALASRVQNLKARLNGIVKVLKVVEKRVSGTLSLVEDRKG